MVGGDVLDLRSHETGIVRETGLKVALMSETLALIAEQMTRVNKLFLKGLEGFSETSFFTNLPNGGHSAAWHALHIADWTQILVPANFEGIPTDLRLGHLGWEDASWIADATGPSPANLTDTKDAILEYLRRELERGVETVKTASADRLEARISTPMGERVVRNLLLTQLGHVPYHYGQVKMTAKQLEH